MSDASEPTEASYPPGWLIALFAVQGLGSLVQLFCMGFSTLFASAFPERVFAISYLVGLVVLSLALATTFFIGAFRRTTQPPAVRFARVHAVAAAIASAPVMVLFIASAVTEGGRGDTRGVISSILFALACVVVPALGVFLTFRQRRWLVVVAGVLALVWVFVSALLFLGSGVGAAGITA